MSAVTGFGRFWWDFIVGDDSGIAAGVVTCLTVGAALVSETDAPGAIVSIVVAAGVIAVVAASLVRVARRARRARPEARDDAPMR